MLAELSGAGIEPSLDRRDFALILAATLAVFTAYNLVLPVLPLAVLASGGSRSMAGIATAATAGGTMLLDLTAARLMLRWSERTVMLGGLGLSLSAGVLLAAVSTLPAIVIAALALGIGFGATVTTASIAIATRAPTEKRGRLFGGYGAATTAPSTYAPGAALLINAVAGPRAVFALAAAACAIGTVAVLPTGLRYAPARRQAAVAMSGGRWRALAAPTSAFVCMTLAYGGVVGFAALLIPGRGAASPAAFLVVFGLTRALVRAVSGPLVDRWGGRRVQLFATGVGSLGLLVLGLAPGPADLVAAVLFGAGFAAAQNASFADMIDRSRRSDRPMVAGVWNFSIDIGVVAAALLVAPFGAAAGFVRVPWLLLAVAALGLVALIVEWVRIRRQNRR